MTQEEIVGQRRNISEPESDKLHFTTAMLQVIGLYSNV